MGPRVILRTLLSVVRGNFGPPGGDVLQMAGTFVIDRDAIIRLAYRSRDASDLPPLVTVFGALRGP
jgi:hypothetical protein